MAERGAGEVGAVEVSVDELGVGRRGPSLVLLVSGLAAIAVGVGVGFGLAPTVVRVIVDSPVDPRWILVALTLLAGAALLVGGLRRR